MILSLLRAQTASISLLLLRRLLFRLLCYPPILAPFLHYLYAFKLDCCFSIQLLSQQFTKSHNKELYERKFFNRTQFVDTAISIDNKTTKASNKTPGEKKVSYYISRTNRDDKLSDKAIVIVPMERSNRAIPTSCFS